MKKFILFFAVVGMATFTSCSSDDDSGAPAVPTGTAITLTSSSTAINLGQSVTLSVMNNLSPSVDVSSTSTFTANGAGFTGPTFTPTVAGTYVIVAKNGGLTSNEVTVTVSAVATAITLTSSATAVDLGQSVTLSVMNNLSPSVDVTSTSTFTANGTAFTGPTFTPTVAGTYVIVANNGGLTSNEVTVVISDVVVANSIFTGGVNYSVNQSAVVFWGGYDLSGDGVVDHAYWSTLVFTGTAIADNATSSNFIDVEFLTPLTETGGVALPTTTNVVNLGIYELRLNAADVVIDTQESSALVFAQDITNTLTTAAFTYNAGFNSSSTLALNYNSSFLGVYDGSGRPAARGNMSVQKLSLKEIRARKAAFSFKK